MLTTSILGHSHRPEDDGGEYNRKQKGGSLMRCHPPCPWDIFPWPQHIVKISSCRATHYHSLSFFNRARAFVICFLFSYFGDPKLSPVSRSHLHTFFCNCRNPLGPSVTKLFINNFDVSTSAFKESVHNVPIIFAMFVSVRSRTSERIFMKFDIGEIF
jgi:hypothetical protein